MIRIWRSGEDGLVEHDSSAVESGAWVNMVAPTEEEIDRISIMSGVPVDFLHAPLDTEEPSRMEIDSESVMILINIPTNSDGDIREYGTLPLGIIVTPDLIITVCTEENRVMRAFDAVHAGTFDTASRSRFVFQILYRSASIFLKDLRQMNRQSDRMEENLRASLRNKELFALLDLQKGLTYYSISLRSNQVVIGRLLRFASEDHPIHTVKLQKKDRDLLDDVRVEYTQAIEMAQIQTEVLAGMMDAFASVISNNLNVVMKFLASVTIVLSIPTIIASFFGMNVPIPWSGHPLGFWLIIVVSFMCAVAAAFVLWKRNLF